MRRETSVASGVGCANADADVGLDSDAYLESSVQLFFRVPHRLPVQRGEFAAAVGGSGEFVSFPCVCELERGAGEEIRASRVLVGRANRNGQRVQPGKSECGGE